MVRALLSSLLLSGALAGAQEPLVFASKPYACPPLQFEVEIPEGWNAQQDRTGIVVRGNGEKMGFMVTREPFLHEPKTFAESWGRVLGRAGLETEVEEERAGRYEAYRSSWRTDDDGEEDGDASKGRSIQVWRLYVPEVEMLYNISFSAPKGVDVEPLVEGVLDSFECTAPRRAELEFQETPERLGARVSLRLPKGYEKDPEAVSLGGGARSWRKTIEGYEEPHVAGTISFRPYDARISYEMADGTLVRGGDVKELVKRAWMKAQQGFSKITRRPRGRSTRVAGMRGYRYSGSALSKKGLPKHFYAFGGKVNRAVIVITIVVDEREERLYKKIGKRICSQLSIKE